MTIRPAVPADFPRLRALLADNGQMIEGVDYATFSPPCLVLVRSAAVVGFIQALVGRPVAVITDLAIDPAHHRKGYGVRLLSHMDTLLRDYGVTAWVAYAGSKKTTVQRALTKYGAASQGDGTGYVRRLNCP